MDNLKINFKYKYAEDYNPVYVNGAYGGISTRNEILVNFYLERSPIPKETDHNINADGSLSEPIAIKPEDFEKTVIRYVSSGIVMNLETAKSINAWLSKNIEELENRRGINDSSEEHTDASE
ncbi:DUF3467 domain-containing protein [Anaerolactibacter massiliensis]|uniref:DUF3467 domain-containing protein n=1 Tax=Anaerolactibacter massiliensis TaxID=2044573 RepID=UPI000CF998FF|nr:DUF3467 domain-containing protein [Anaerolactibacter massiliensis]